ncbi:MAG: hypothetical protein ABJA02_12755 [Acidobacteriota bacterium]
MESARSEDKWQVEANGQLFETDLAQMTGWIAEGALLRHDKVRKGNLRFIEAGKVPLLIDFFNAKESGTPLPPLTVSISTPADDREIRTDVALPTAAVSTFTIDTASDTASKVCSVHSDITAAYACSSCASLFCKTCPNSYGGSVKICPNCGALCDALKTPPAVVYRPVSRPSAGVGAFGFGDVAFALAYPFRFKASFVFGAIMFAFFSMGQSIVGFGGMFMLSAAIICAMLANTLTFGILANTVENMAAGRLGLNFMPTFEEFSVWDDVFQPFFLMIGVYISSFGPLAVLFIISFFVLSGPANSSKRMNGVQTEAAQVVAPELPYAASAAEQSDRVKEILKKTGDEQRARVDAINNGTVPQNAAADHSVNPDAGGYEVDQINRAIQAQQKAQLEAAVGQTPETVSAQRSAMIAQIAGYGSIFLILASICCIWAFIYYPAACAVAGYTRSFSAVINPSVGLDTIRRLGGDYLKVLLMCLVIGACFAVVSFALSSIFYAFDMPGVGNLPAKIVGSLFGFYFSIVFAIILGSALYKAADRLELPGA